jgi:threonine dehydrogenase-like Zn-dependent dehydrogenase
LFDKTMRAAVYRAPGDIRVEEVAMPDVGSGDVLLQIINCGICGSDLHSFHSGQFVKSGQILGHEFVGRVAAVGKDVVGISEGVRATGFSMGICGECYWCTRGQYNLCPLLFHASTGYGLPGGFADYVLIPSAQLGINVHLIPDGVSDAAAALTEPVSVAVGTIFEARIHQGDSVVVLGGGAIGNACLQVAKTAGAGKVILIDISPLRLEAARQAGADAVFDASDGGALEWVQEEVGVGKFHFGEGAMADVVIEAAGSPITVAQSFDMVRSGGTIAFVALSSRPALIDTNRIVHKSPRIVGCLAGDFPRSIELIASGQVRTELLVTHQFDLAEVSEAFEIASDSHAAIKTLVTMQS